MTGRVIRTSALYSEPVYQRDAEIPELYWADEMASRAVFVSLGTGTLGASPTLLETWTDAAGGAYLFVEEGADDLSVRTAVRAWLANRPAVPLPRFGWLATLGQLQPLPAGGGADGRWTLDGSTTDLADYQLAVRGGVAIAPGELPGPGWGFRLAPDPAGPPALALFTPRAVLPAEDGSALLDLSGRWHFTVTGEPDPAVVAEHSLDVFAQLGVGLRFFQAADDGSLAVARFPVLTAAEERLRLLVTLDPTRPCDADRSQVTFGSHETDDGPEGPVLASTYVTHVGDPTTLTPVGHGGLSPGRLVFAESPRSLGSEGDAGLYLTLDGSFRVGGVATTESPGTPPLHRLLCGLNGSEMLRLPDNCGCLTFLPGRPALVVPPQLPSPGPALSLGATTSWVRIDGTRPDQEATYGSAPAGAVPYREPPPPVLDPPWPEHDHVVLHPYEPDTAVLPIGGVPPPANAPEFPLAPFSAVVREDLALAVNIEQCALAPTRQGNLARASVPRARPDQLPVNAPELIGVTPQGLAVGVDPSIDPQDPTWNWVSLGHWGTASSEPNLCVAPVGDAFKKALQTSNLFLVLAPGGASPGGTRHVLTPEALDHVDLLPGPGIRAEVRSAVRTSLANTANESADALRARIADLVPDVRREELDRFVTAADELTAEVDGWRFRLSPTNPTDPTDPTKNPTYLILKFLTDRSIDDLVDDLAAWTWPEAAGAVEATTQKAVRAILDDAMGRPTGSSYANFVQVITSKTWTGVLALSPEVPLERLPDEVQPLAAGIVRGLFRGHHFGITLTPFDPPSQPGTAPMFQPSSTFALLDYENPEDQYTNKNVSFSFRVQRLTLEIRNSAVTAFTSRAQLLVNRLFGSPTRLVPTDTGNNLDVVGALKQNASGVPGYSFAFGGDQTFALEGGALRDVEVLSAQLLPVSVPTAAEVAAAVDPTDAPVRAVFQLAGNLRFLELPDVDIFGWGPAADPTDTTDRYLRFGNLGVTMEFARTAPETPIFGLDVSALTFDLASSTAPRPNSFAACFPARLTGLLAGTDPGYADPGPGSPLPGSSMGAPPSVTPVSSPADLGYTSISIPLQQQELTQPWFGLDYTIDLGSLGAQAGSSAIAVHLLMAWSPVAACSGPVVYAGALLPGAGSKLAASLPLQGVITLGFGSIELLVDDTSTPRAHTLRLRDFGLKLLGLSLPPGRNDVILFANPVQSADTKVGWYVAYAADADPSRTPPPITRDAVGRLQAATRSSGGE